jgi:hypothetical protein
MYLVNIRKIRKMLMEIEEKLLKVASRPPDEPVVSSDIVDSIYEARRIAIELANMPGSRLLHTHETFIAIYRTLGMLDAFVDELFRLCYAAWMHGIRVQPDPCNEVTLDYFIEWIVRDFWELARHVKPAIEAELGGEIKIETKEKGEGFLNRLQLLSSACVQFIGVNCLRYASPEKVTRLPLRAHVIDLASAIGLIDDYVVKSYYGISEWRAGLIRLYVHPKTTGELLDLAEHASNVLHKIIEVGILGKWWADRVAVYSLADRVEIIREEDFHVVVKPRWVVDVHLFKKDFIETMRRILSERGFKTELTDYGFKIIIPPGDVRDAVKLACVLSAALLVYFINVAEAYGIALSSIELVESKLREQKPLKKRKVSL